MDRKNKGPFKPSAIEAPQEERIAATLYYIGAYSHRKIADFPKTAGGLVFRCLEAR